jgi:integrase
MHDGERYSITRGKYAIKADRDHLRAIAHQIYADCLKGDFDKSLARYRKWSSPIKPKISIRNTLDLWNAWNEFLLEEKGSLGSEYGFTKALIIKSCPKLDETKWLAEKGWSASTFNKALRLLKKCFDWGIKEGLISENPWENFKARKQDGNEIDPFTKEEMKRILTFFQEGKSPDGVRYPEFRWYKNFIHFFFLTGQRPAEVMGLQWGDIDWERGIIHIRRSYSTNNVDGANYRIAKETKTGESWTLPLSAPIAALLMSEQEKQGCPEDKSQFIFRTQNGGDILWGNFRVRYWKRALKILGIPYRYPYQVRHTVLSHAAADPNIGVMGAAQIAGHKNSKMVHEHYGKFINQPKLPDIL